MINPPDMEKMFGTPAIAFVHMQRWYRQRQDKENPLFQRDMKWFAAHRLNTRTIRRADANEFKLVEPSMDYFGVAIPAPPLWVCVEQRFWGHDHVVTPVYRGRCHWQQDSAGYALVDESKDEGGNLACDELLLQFDNSDGINIMDMNAYVYKIAEVEMIKAKTGSHCVIQDGSIH